MTDSIYEKIKQVVNCFIYQIRYLRATKKHQSHELTAGALQIIMETEMDFEG
jgi:hypothetical protein